MPLHKKYFSGKNKKRFKTKNRGRAINGPSAVSV